MPEKGLEFPGRSHAERAMPARSLPLRDLRRTSPRIPSRGDVPFVRRGGYHGLIPQSSNPQPNRTTWASLAVDANSNGGSGDVDAESNGYSSKNSSSQACPLGDNEGGRKWSKQQTERLRNT